MNWGITLLIVTAAAVVVVVAMAVIVEYSDTRRAVVTAFVFLVSKDSKQNFQIRGARFLPNPLSGGRSGAHTM